MIAAVIRGPCHGIDRVRRESDWAAYDLVGHTVVWICSRRASTSRPRQSSGGRATPHSRGPRTVDLDSDGRPHQLRLARPLAEDLRPPWEKPCRSDPAHPGPGTPGVQNIRAHLACPTRFPTHRHPGAGRPPGAKNKHGHPATTSARPSNAPRPSRSSEAWKILVDKEQVQCCFPNQGRPGVEKRSWADCTSTRPRSESVLAARWASRWNFTGLAT